MPQQDADDCVDGLPHNLSDDQLYRGPGDYLRYEQYRLDTYDSWPTTANVDKGDLAANGFYYLGEGDRVKCAFCNIILSKWERGDSVVREHTNFAPRCPLLTNIETAGNIPFRQVSGAHRQNLSTPKYSEYRSRDMRLKSFGSNWPRDVKQTPGVLASAGFFYLGQGDAVKCFHCGGVLRHWDDPDIPWEEHKKWFPECKFILENGVAHQEETRNESLYRIARGNGYNDDLLTFHKNYIKENGIPCPESYEELVDHLEQLRVSQESGSSSSSSGATGQSPSTRQEDVTRSLENEARGQGQPSAGSNTPQQSRPHTIQTQWSRDNRFECKICFDNHVEVLLIPCQHVCCCQKCTDQLKVKECPICRTKIKGIQPLYFA